MLVNYFSNNSQYLWGGILGITLFFTLCAIYAKYINSRRPANDPKKRDFHPAAIFLVPFTWPLLSAAFILLLVLRLVFLILKVVAYGVFLVLFPFVLLGLRGQFLFAWIDKILTSIGNKLMEANTFLIRLFLRPWAGTNGSA
jgi:hypothetical protein